MGSDKKTVHKLKKEVSELDEDADKMKTMNGEITPADYKDEKILGITGHLYSSVIDDNNCQCDHVEYAVLTRTNNGKYAVREYVIRRSKLEYNHRPEMMFIVNEHLYASDNKKEAEDKIRSIGVALEEQNPQLSENKAFQAEKPFQKGGKRIGYYSIAQLDHSYLVSLFSDEKEPETDCTP